MSNPSPTPQKRLAGLDGLRAIAILLVILYHTSFITNIYLPEAIDPLIREGRFGVTIFFVLSGFLITYLLCHEEKKSTALNSRPSLKKFYFRRAFRILPAAFAYLITLAILARLHIIDLPSVDLVYCSLFVRNLAYPQFGASITAHYWSLSIEEQFYLLWPLLFLLTKGRTRLLITALFIAAAPFWRFTTHHLGFGIDLYPIRTDLRYDALLTGCLLALLRQDPSFSLFLKKPLLQNPLLLVSALLLIYITGFQYPTLPRILGALAPTLSFLGIAFLINYLIQDHSDPFSRLINTKPLVWIGKMSYSLYLWQQLFIIPAQKLPHWMIHLPANLALTFAAASLSYYCIETPALRLRDRLEKKRTSQTSTDFSTPDPLPSAPTSF